MTVMEVEVLSKKMIKPEVSTPHELKTCKLSFLDQLAPPDHVPIIYFYQNSSSSSSSSLEIRKLLVKSVSKTLNQFYPLAGRFVLDGFYVDCNDEGVLYIDAQVNLQLDEFVGKAKDNMELISDLVPRPHFGETHSFTTPIMGLQVSFFKCGGVAIGMHLSHIVADGFTAALFIKEWATTTTGLINGQQLVSSSTASFSFASLFTSRDLSTAIRPAVIPSSKMKMGKIITKRFLFQEKAMETLKANVSKFENLKRPTRVEVVTSIIWKALIRVSKIPHSTLYLHLNLRGRTAMTTTPPLDNPATCGNFYMQVPAKYKAKNGSKELELHHMAKLLRSSLHTALGNCSKISNPNALFSEATKYVNEIEEDMGNEEVEVRLLTTLCRMPLYETEFGWGKPEWVTIPPMQLEIVFLLDTKCGTGIEATVSLNEVDMLQFQLDPTIIAFAC